MAERHTMQKEIVYSALKELHNHPTADAVYSYIHSQYPSISRATVYRRLNQMAENGEVSRVELFDGADCFDHNVMPHCHARCSQCHKIYDLSCVVPKLSSLINSEEAFEVTSYSLQFTGICRSCKNENIEEA